LYTIFLIAIIVGLFSSPIVFAEESIPDWVKTTAEFWIKGDVSDSEFIDALEFLIEQGVLTVPQSENIMQSSSSNNIQNSDRVLFTNVNIFDGKNNKLQQNMNVLVEGNKITKISSSTINSNSNTLVIEGNGKTLMPGLIDGHVHFAINHNYGVIENDKTLEDITIRSTLFAKHWLMDGYTTVRDAGGPVFGLKRAIDAGEVPGPRIFPSGAMISQTSGHGDFRALNDPHPTIEGVRAANWERMGIVAIADGRDEVLTQTRQNLMQGATQIKIMAGGGGSSKYDPIDTCQYTLDEIKAAVEAASDWNTYVMAHIFLPKCMDRAMDAGVKTFEHAFFIDEPTAKRISEEGVYLVSQMTGFSPEALNNPLLPSDKLYIIENFVNYQEEYAELVTKYDLKVVHQTDAVGEPEDAAKQIRYELYYRGELFGPFEALKQATSVAGEMMELSGPRNNYDGKLGVVEEGALADILLVDGNPLEDLSVLGANSKWFDAETPQEIQTINIIMKDGVIYKNSLN